MTIPVSHHPTNRYQTARTSIDGPEARVITIACGATFALPHGAADGGAAFVQAGADGGGGDGGIAAATGLGSAVGGTIGNAPVALYGSSVMR